MSGRELTKPKNRSSRRLERYPIASQLLREYWLPASIAMSWVAISLVFSPENRKFIQSVNIFFSTLFLASTFVSQYFRVRKQQGVDRKLQDVENQLKETAKRLEETARVTLGNITGGDSIAILDYRNPDIPQALLVNIGEFPMYDLRMSIADREEKIHRMYLEGMDPMHQAGPVYQTGLLMPRVAQSIPLNHVRPHKAREHNSNRRTFAVSFQSRSGSYTQIIVHRKVNESWEFAFKFSKAEKLTEGLLEETIIFVEHSKNFPEPLLEINWDLGNIAPYNIRKKPHPNALMSARLSERRRSKDVIKDLEEKPSRVQ